MRRLALAVGLALAFTLLVVASSIPSALTARRELESGRDAMEQARRALTSGDIDLSRDRFAEAMQAFGRARNAAGFPSLALVGWVPLAGRSVDAVRALAAGGASAAQAGALLARGVADAGGVEGLAARVGRIPIERISPLADVVADAAPLIERARADVEAAASSFVFTEIERARAVALAELERVVATLDAAQPILDGLPTFLGDARPTVYLVGAENPAELRGSGGLIGAYALLRFDQGAMRLASFVPIQTLPRLDPQDVAPPSEEYSRLYDADRKGRGFWLNVNMTPDFPSAAVALQRSFEAATGAALDGVITADPFALRDLVKATGPAEVPSLDLTVRAEDVVPLMSSAGFELIEDPEKRKRVLGDVAGAIVRRAVASADADVIRSVLETASQGHLKVYSSDPELQSGLAMTGAGGAFEIGDGDFLSVVQNNAAGNKLDYYARRDVVYEVWLEPGGTSRATATVSLTNATPDVELPGRVLGLGPSLGLAPGETRSLLNVYCARCSLVSATKEGQPIEVTGGSELGATFFQHDLLIPPGESRTVAMSWVAEDVWNVDGSAAGTYRLAIDGQTMIRPTTIRVIVHPPDGLRPTRVSRGMYTEGGAAVWEGAPTAMSELEVSMEAPLPVALWRELTSLLE